MVNDDVNIISGTGQHNSHLFFDTACLFFAVDGGKFD